MIHGHIWRTVICQFFHRRHYECRQLATHAVCHCNKCGRVWAIGL